MKLLGPQAVSVGRTTTEEEASITRRLIGKVQLRGEEEKEEEEEVPCGIDKKWRRVGVVQIGRGISCYPVFNTELIP